MRSKGVFLRCPYCIHADTKVVESREVGNLEITRRRRECLKCGKRFTTYERVEEVDLWVIKKDGSREKFNAKKLYDGIARACEKLPVSPEKIEAIVEDIQRHLRLRETLEVTSKEIGELVMTRLKKVDKVAYIRFASVYREFADVDSFEKELRKLLRKKKGK